MPWHILAPIAVAYDIFFVSYDAISFETKNMRIAHPHVSDSVYTLKDIK